MKRERTRKKKLKTNILKRETRYLNKALEHYFSAAFAMMALAILYLSFFLYSFFSLSNFSFSQCHFRDYEKWTLDAQTVEMNGASLHASFAKIDITLWKLLYIWLFTCSHVSLLFFLTSSYTHVKQKKKKHSKLYICIYLKPMCMCTFRFSRYVLLSFVSFHFISCCLRIFCTK